MIHGQCRLDKCRSCRSFSEDWIQMSDLTIPKCTVREQWLTADYDSNGGHRTVTLSGQAPRPGLAAGAAHVGTVDGRFGEDGFRDSWSRAAGTTPGAGPSA